MLLSMIKNKTNHPMSSNSHLQKLQIKQDTASNEATVKTDFVLESPLFVCCWADKIVCENHFEA